MKRKEKYLIRHEIYYHTSVNFGSVMGNLFLGFRRGSWSYYLNDISDNDFLCMQDQLIAEARGYLK